MPAMISLYEGAKRQPCMVLDVSPGGGRVRLLPGAFVPDNFTLLLTPCGKVRRACRVVWRRENQIGVEFFGRFDRL